jgi:hypothetical protein
MAAFVEHEVTVDPHGRKLIISGRAHAAHKDREIKTSELRKAGSRASLRQLGTVTAEP